MAEKEAPVKLKKTSKRYSNYEISGSSVKRKNKFCPKCGPGVFLAKHKDRVYCGKCGYVEMNSVDKPVESKENATEVPKEKKN